MDRQIHPNSAMNDASAGLHFTTSAKLSSSPLLARNATLNLIAEGWTFLTLIVAFPKLVAYLGNTRFGLFSLAWVVIGYLAFLDIGVNRAATKFLSEYLATGNEQSVPQLVRLAILTNLGLGLLGGIVVALASPYFIHSVLHISQALDNEARWTFYIVAFAVPVSLLHGILRAVLTSYQRFGWINSVNLLATTAQWSLAVLLAWKGAQVSLVVLVTVIARLLATSGYGLIVHRLLPAGSSHNSYSLEHLRELVHFGGWVSVSQVISPILVYFDRVLIASLVSLGAVTLYTIPYEMMTRLRVIPSSLAATLYPAFSERGTKGQELYLQQLYERSIRCLLLLLLPATIFLVLLAPDLLTIWLGQALNHETATVMEILGFGVLANGLSYVPYNMLQAVGRPDITGKFHLIELPPYLLLCLVLIPRFGIAGAAMASTIRFAIDFALLFWAADKQSGCTFQGVWTKPLRRILFLGLALAGLLVAIRMGVESSKLRIGLGLVSGLLYAVASWIFAIGDFEKPRISAALRKLWDRPEAQLAQTEQCVQR
ncbi:MAG: flippase [Terriglobales bacterium]